MDFTRSARQDNMSRARVCAHGVCADGLQSRGRERELSRIQVTFSVRNCERQRNASWRSTRSAEQCRVEIVVRQAHRVARQQQRERAG